MFSVSDLLLVNKIDYLALSDFDIVALRKRALTLNPGMAILEISCSGAGIEEWIKWLRQELGAFRKCDAGTGNLITAAVTIGFFHTLFGPDHYVPFIVMSKARKWSFSKQRGSRSSAGAQGMSAVPLF